MGTQKNGLDEVTYSVSCALLFSLVNSMMLMRCCILHQLIWVYTVSLPSEFGQHMGSFWDLIHNMPKSHHAPMIDYADVSSGARGLSIGLIVHLHPYLVHVRR